MSADASQAEQTLLKSEERFRQLAENIQDVFWIGTPDWNRVFYVSPAYETLWGRSCESLYRQPRAWLDAVHEQDRAGVLAAIDMKSAGDFKEVALPEYRVVRPDGTICWILNRVFPIRNEHGEVCRVAGIAEDITQRKCTEDNLREAGQALQQQVDQRTAELGRETQQRQQTEQSLRVSEAEFQAVFQSAPVIMILLDWGGRVRRANRLAATCLADSPPDMQGVRFANVMRCVHAFDDPDGCGYGPCCATCVVRRTIDDTFRTGRPHHAQEAKLTVTDGQQPREKHFLVSTSVPDPPYGQGVLVCIQDITERKATEEAVRETTAELLAAQRIQQHFLPDKPPDLPGFDIAGASYAARFAAGDYFDYLSMTGGTIGVAIGDVSGHGVGASLLMASTCAHLRSLAEAGIEVDEMLSRTNASLLMETGGENFVTTILARLDPTPASPTLIYANAGHPPGCVISATGDIKASLESRGVPLAVLPDPEFPLGEPIPLEAGDLVLLLTDGVLEARSSEGELFGMNRALEVVRRNLDKTAQAIVEQIHQAARKFCPQEEPSDDLTIVVIRVEPPQE